jgi:hypothetical protein
MMVFQSVDSLSQLLQSELGVRFAVRMVKEMHQLPDNIAKAASIMVSATPFFFCRTQKHLTVKRVWSSRA